MDENLTSRAFQRIGFEVSLERARASASPKYRMNAPLIAKHLALRKEALLKALPAARAGTDALVRVRWGTAKTRAGRAFITSGSPSTPSSIT